MAQNSLISPEHLYLGDTAQGLDQTITATLERLLNQGATLPSMLADMRQRLVTLALERSDGDRSAAARLLGVDEAELG